VTTDEGVTLADADASSCVKIFDSIKKQCPIKHVASLWNNMIIINQANHSNRDYQYVFEMIKNHLLEDMRYQDADDVLALNNLKPNLLHNVSKSSYIYYVSILAFVHYMINTFLDLPSFQLWGIAYYVIGVVACLTTIILRAYFSHEYYYYDPNQKQHYKKLRSLLWNTWRQTNIIDGCNAMLMDEEILRKVPELKMYWKKRDIGNLNDANLVLRAANIDNFSNISHLALGYSDLQIGSFGGTAIRRKDDDGEGINVIGIDSGTWPMDGGGVASCRRDLVDRMEGVNWHMIVEIGNDNRMVSSSYQVEKNVDSLNYVSLWSDNLGCLSQSVLSHLPYGSHIDKMKRMTNRRNIETYFLPLISQLIDLCVADELNEDHLILATKLGVNLYEYFKIFSWDLTWNHEIVSSFWCTNWWLMKNQTQLP